MNTLNLKECLGIDRPDRLYYVSKTDINPSTGKAYAINPRSGVWDDNYWAQEVDPVINRAEKQQEAMGRQQEETAARQKAETAARFAANKEEVSGFTQRYGEAVPKIIGDVSNKYQLGELLGQTNALNTRVKDLQGNLSGTGAGGYASASQVDKAINSKYLPLYQTAVQNLQTGTTLAQSEAGMLLKPYETEASLLNDRLAREATGYDHTQQRELDGLLAALNAGVELTKAEMNRAVQLAELEQQKYLKEKELASVKNDYLTLSEGQTVYNPVTGQIMYTAPKTYKPTGGTGSTGIAQYYK